MSNSKVPDSARAAYFKALSSVKILKPAEERVIYKQYADSGFTDQEARRKLVEGCLRLVVTRAARFCRGNDDLLDELVCAGNEGLLIALEKYDPTKGTRVPSYAIWWIDLYIRNSLSANHPVKIPMWRQKKGVKLRRLRATGMSTEKMAEECSLSVAQVHELEKYRCVGVDIDVLQAPDSMTYAKSVSTYDFFRHSNIEEMSVSMSSSELLNEVISELSEEDQVVIRSYYGVGREPLNLPQLADTRGVTSERVRQIKNKLLIKLKALLKKRGISAIEDIL